MPGADGRYRLLIVDDEPPVRLLLDRILIAGGYHTTVAFDAADAIRLLETWKPVDLLVSDVVMPDMSGDEMVCRMRQTQPDLKVLYVTGFAGRVFWEKPALDHEAYVEKPISPAGLLEAVSLALFGHTRGLP